MKPDFIINVNPGRYVICDICNKDWTESDVSGGFLFGSKGVCPDCAPEMEKSIAKYNEQEYIVARCPEGMSHANWIRGIVRRGQC